MGPLTDVKVVVDFATERDPLSHLFECNLLGAERLDEKPVQLAGFGKVLLLDQQVAASQGQVEHMAVFSLQVPVPDHALPLADVFDPETEDGQVALAVLVVGGNVQPGAVADLLLFRNVLVVSVHKVPFPGVGDSTLLIIGLQYGDIILSK